MFFRNLTLFRFPKGLERRFEQLEARLAEHPLRPCGPLELKTRGFVSPYGRGEKKLAIVQGSCTLIALGAEDKILPTALVHQRVAEKLESIQRQRGRSVGPRERRKLKDDVLTELLPQALARPSHCAGFLDLAAGWLVVDTSSRKAADGFVSALRTALGGFPATRLEPQESPRARMTEWMIEGWLPDGFAFGDECELKDPADDGAIVRCRRQDLAADEMREHLASGKQVTQLALTFQERMRFVLDEALTVRKFKLLDVAVEPLERSDRETVMAELDARFALLSQEVARLLAAIETLFGVFRPEPL